MTDAHNGRRNEQLREQILLGLRDPFEKMEQAKAAGAHLYEENASRGINPDKESDNSSFQ